MKKISVKLANCYGIKTLDKTFDFSKRPAYALYAPNGVMKSSLAQTFKDASEKQTSEDRIFPGRPTTREISDESGKPVEGDQILVVLPYDEQYGPTEKTSTLLVDAKLRAEYAKLHVVIDEAKAEFLKALKAKADSKADFEKQIGDAFTSGDGLEIALHRIESELAKQVDAPFADVPYDTIFNDKVIAALNTKGLKDAVEDYIKRYNQLISSSVYFKKGTFEYFNASQIAKSLTDNGFFNAKHTVTLKSSGETVEINNQQELEDIISKEKSAILSDSKLRKTFEDVAKQLDKNAELREFCNFLKDNEAILSRMNNPAKLKEDVLKSYIKSNELLYNDLMKKYDTSAKRKAEIEEEAKKQQTQWEAVIDIFNDRFFVPFKLSTLNKIQVMLGSKEIVRLGFTYVDGHDSVDVDKATLMTVLSAGERKALYILNVIFEIERRRKAGQETFVIVDDIADSFDYQNKYAIIEYLKDISESGPFKMLIMTHNFDFLRTIESRFVGYANCLMASKGPNGPQIVKAAGIRNIFANDWKPKFFSDDTKKIASICFLRNLVEMTTGEADPKYLKLTSMVHWKTDSAVLKVADLDAIFNAICGTSGASANHQTLIFDLIIAQAASAAGAAGMSLEGKIVLAIAIRLLAERYMIKEIGDPAFVSSIAENQTQKLISKFKSVHAGKKAEARVLDRVALMTPESIHVNSFMYEPILDMADDHLRKLLADVQALP